MDSFGPYRGCDLHAGRHPVRRHDQQRFGPGQGIAQGAQLYAGQAGFDRERGCTVRNEQ